MLVISYDHRSIKCVASSQNDYGILLEFVRILKEKIPPTARIYSPSNHTWFIQDPRFISLLKLETANLDVSWEKFI